jgi:predicted SnoaL-like aldol condensation-catalyzing enzyme
MKTTVRRVADKLADVVREMHEAQRLMLVLRTAPDRYIQHPGAAPDTYDEFLARTAGVLRHEPPARKRIRKARHD